MSSSAAKKDDDLLAEVVELSPATDREQGLSQNFDDPVLEDMIPGLVDTSSSGESEPVHMSLVEETVEAVQELVAEAQPDEKAIPQFTPALETPSGSADLSSDFGDLQLTPDSDSRPVESNEFTMSALINASASVEHTDEASKITTRPEDVLSEDSMEEPASIFVLDGNVNSEDNSHARYEMSEKLFQLVICERSFDDLVENALLSIMHALDAQAGAVLELDVEHQEYFFRTSIGGGDPEKVKSFRVPLNKGIVGHVGESRQATLLRDLEADQMQMRAISMSVGFEAKTCMAAPILVAGQLFGVIEFFNRKGGGFFEQRDLQVLEEGTRMFSKVLEVRFLMAELMRRAR